MRKDRPNEENDSHDTEENASSRPFEEGPVRDLEAMRRPSPSIWSWKTFPHRNLVLGIVGFFTAAIIILLVLLSTNHRMPARLDFREAAAKFAGDGNFLLDRRTSDLREATSWLREREAPSFYSLPETLIESDLLGIKMLRWRGHPVSLVSFYRTDGRVFHLFIVRRGDVTEDSVFAGIERITTPFRLETGGWHADGKVFLLVGSSPGVSIREYLPPVRPLEEETLPDPVGW